MTSVAAGNAGTVSSQIRSRLAESGSLLSALDAITQWKPFVLLASTFVACVIAITVMGAITAALAQNSGTLAAIMGAIAAILVLGMALIGTNAVGIMLADDVWDRPQRSITDALLTSVFTSHRLVFVLLLEGLLFLVFLIVFTVILFLCKIPGIGPLLYAVVFPVGVLATGITLFALIFVAIPLAAPAIWSGATVMQALAMLKEVARQKLLYVVIMTLLLGLLLMLVGGIVGTVLTSGTMLTLSLSAAVVGASSGGLNELIGIFSGFNMGGGVNGYAVALSFGGAVIFLIGATPGALVGMKGAAIIHRASTEDLSLADIEAAMNQKLEDIKRRAQEAKERAMAAAPTQQSAPASKKFEPVTTNQLLCPACQATVTADDVFCGSCGNKMR